VNIQILVRWVYLTFYFTIRLPLAAYCTFAPPQNRKTAPPAAPHYQL